MIKRKKIGNTTITINTKTGRQTTSRRTGNITHSQSNQGHNRRTVTTNYGNGWFDRQTTNLNKKGRKKKSNWSWLFGSDSKTTLKQSTNNVKEIEKQQPFVGPPYPVFWKRLKFKDFTFLNWIQWLLAFPFRAMWFAIIWIVRLILLFVAIKFIVLLIDIVL